jgi:hypothetical protein
MFVAVGDGGWAIRKRGDRCNAVMSESGQLHALPRRSIAVCFTQLAESIRAAKRFRIVPGADIMEARLITR